MQIIQEIFDTFESSYPIESIGPLEELLFIDIETTGFSARSSFLYLIGCAFYLDGQWCIKQYFTETPEEQDVVLTSFYEFASAYKTLVHFNGNTFDIPYLNQKCEQLKLGFDFNGFSGFDIYKRILPYKSFIKIPNCKQKTIEQYLGIDRKDLYTGGELIDFYLDYTKKPTKRVLDLLLLHNSDDMKGMLMITPILAYSDLFNGKIRVTKVQANKVNAPDGSIAYELLMKLTLPKVLPSPISCLAENYYFNGSEKNGVLKVPLYEEEMKYFYANYKNYYYLPAEDQALHKSVASFVDKNHRVQATAATCYTRKYSLYLPVWGTEFEPFFKRDFRSKQLFIELTDERKTDRDFFSQYASHIMNILNNL